MPSITTLKMGFFIALLIIAFASRLQASSQDQTPIQYVSTDTSVKQRVAIIGAGAGGSSAAYHLAKIFQETSQDSRLPVDGFDIDIFESNSYIGGRSTTVDALDDPRYPTELGASIFVTVNHVLYDMTRDFELSTRDKIYESTGSLYDLGVWDGSDFVFTIANSDDDNGGWKGRWQGYWDIIKLLWKYGLSPIRTQRAKNSVVSSFLRMYDEYFPVASLTNFATTVGLTDYTGITGEAALAKDWVSEEFSQQIVQSSTRVNYAQNLDSIHGLETMVCMAIEGAMAIENGNWHIFDEAVKRSGANLYLNTTVAGVTRTERGTYQLETKNTSLVSSTLTTREADKQYDVVILAAPYQFSTITFTPPLDPEVIPEEIDYVNLHVTLFTSPHRPSPAFFGLDTQDQVPDSILTTLPKSTESKDTDTTSTPSNSDTEQPAPRGEAAVGPTKFWSLSTLRVLNPEHDPFPMSIPPEDLSRLSKLYTNTNTTSQKQYLYKIFSPVPPTATFISSLFALNHTFPSNSSTISSLPKTDIPWSHTKIWHSYPYLPPRTQFSSMMLDSPYEGRVAWFNEQTKAEADYRDAQGVYYTSGVESFISTMETSALMGRTVAKIIVEGLTQSPPDEL